MLTNLMFIIPSPDYFSGVSLCTLIILYKYVGTTLSRHYSTNVRTTIISVKKSQLVASTLLLLLVVPEVI